jgi:DNA topoisomerase-1
LGDHPTNGEEVAAHNGRFGPYVKCAGETRSLPDGISPLDVTLQQALELLAQPKTQGRISRRREPIKVFDPSPVTKEPVRLLTGRYGPYVTDGQTNASLPRGSSLEEVTFEYALDLLKARAEKGPARRATRRKAAKKKTAKKKTTKTKATRRKAVKKKPAKKKAARKKAAGR